MVSSTENVTAESSSVVIISKPSENLKSSSRLPNLNSSANKASDLPKNLNSNSLAVLSSANNDRSWNTNTAPLSSQAKRSASSKAAELQETTVKSSNSSKWKKNGKTLPQTGEEKGFMDVLSVVGLIVIGGVIGIEIKQHKDR